MKKLLYLGMAVVFAASLSVVGCSEKPKEKTKTKEKEKAKSKEKTKEKKTE